MLGHTDRGGCSNARVFLIGIHVFCAIHSRPTAKPEIAIERNPESRLDIVAQVAFEGPDQRLRLSSYTGKERIIRPELRVRREKPHTCVGIEQPMSPAFRVAKFRFEGPRLEPLFMSFFGSYWTCGSHDPKTHAEDCLLMPGFVLPHGHRRSTLDIHR